MTGKHNQPPAIGETSGFAEVTVSDDMATELYNVGVSLAPGVYADSLATRGEFLADVQDLEMIISGSEEERKGYKGSELSRGLEALRKGEIVSLFVRGLPRDPSLPAPPADGGVPEGKDTFVSEGVALAMANLIGIPSLVIGEKREALVHQITPVAGREETQSNEGAVSLMLHQDLAPNVSLPRMPYAEFMPDWLVLTGLEAGSDNRTGTYIASLDEALASVSPDAQEVLSDPERFVTDPPDSFLKEIDGTPPPPPVHAILSINEAGQAEAAFDTSSNVRPVNPEDKEGLKAIEELNTALTEVRREVVIEPGTAAIFNNRRVVHGRGPIDTSGRPSPRSASSTEGNRWLQRVYVFDADRVVRQAQARHLIMAGGGGMVTVYTVTPVRLAEMS